MASALQCARLVKHPALLVKRFHVPHVPVALMAQGPVCPVFGVGVARAGVETGLMIVEEECPAIWREREGTVGLVQGSTRCLTPANEPASGFKVGRGWKTYHQRQCRECGTSFPWDPADILPPSPLSNLCF